MAAAGGSGGGGVVRDVDALEGVRSIVLKPSEALDESRFTRIAGADFNDAGLGLQGLLRSFKSTGFQASNLGDAIDIVNKMLDWRLSHEEPREGCDEAELDPKYRESVKCKIFLGFTSNLVTSGLREKFRFLAQHRMVDVIVTTAGVIEEDLIKCLAPTYRCDGVWLPGEELRSKGRNRTGNLVVPNDNYCKFENWIMPILDQMLQEQSSENVWTPSKVIARLGKEINDESSYLYWAYKNNIPVYCPALTDGSLGDMLFCHAVRNPGLIIDIVQDIRLMNGEAIHATPRKTGIIILGGGLPKHHICNANMFRNGADYAVYINTAQEFDGSDSGAQPEEAVSWGKIKGSAKRVKVHCDATIAFPLLVAATFSPKVHRSSKCRASRPGHHPLGPKKAEVPSKRTPMGLPPRKAREQKDSQPATQNPILLLLREQIQRAREARPPRRRTGLRRASPDMAAAGSSGGAVRDADALEGVRSIVLKPSETLDESRFTRIAGADFNDAGLGLQGLLRSFAPTGFQASNLGDAIDVVNQMLDWRLSHEEPREDCDKAELDPKYRESVKCKIFLGFTSNLVSSGIRDIVRFLAQHHMVDVIVTTAGGIEEDLIKCLAPTYRGDFSLPGALLRSKGLNRIGNLLVPNDNYCKFENWIMPILDQMLQEQSSENVWTPSKVIARLGKEINDEDSYLYWAYKNNIPVYCPALTDGSLGDMLFCHAVRNPGLIIDIVQDIRLMNGEAIHATPRKTGIIVLGGGLPKHHICNANMFRNGADYAVYINTAQEYDGSDSGAQPDEAVSWGKIKGSAKPVKVHCDATIAFPLLVAATFAPKVHRSKSTN